MFEIDVIDFLSIEVEGREERILTIRMTMTRQFFSISIFIDQKGPGPSQF